MFKFEDSWYFIYALAAIVLIGLYFLSKYIKARRDSKLGETLVLEKISVTSGKRSNLFKLILAALAVLLISLSLTNPQLGRKKEKHNVESTDVFIALDISNSMLCEDVRPNRLQRAKLFATQIVDRLRGERIGLVLFAGGAYMQSPITTDYATLKMFIETAATDQAGTQGTNFAEALDVCINAFPKEDKRPGAIIFVTDGENHEPEDLEAAKRAKSLGYSIYTVGVGTEKGGEIPWSGRNGKRDVKRMQDGTPVVTRLNKNTIVNIAQKGGGKGFLISEGEKVYATIAKEVDAMEKTQSEQLLFAEFESYFQYFLGPALILLILEFLLPLKKIIA